MATKIKVMKKPVKKTAVSVKKGVKSLKGKK